MVDREETGALLRIVVNGEPKQVPPMTLAQWLDAAQTPADTVATAVNGDFVPRANRDSQALRDGDRLDIFRAIVGG